MTTTTNTAACQHPRSTHSRAPLNVAAPLDCAETLHLWVEAESDGGHRSMVMEFVPNWLRNSLAFDVDTFTGRLEDFRAQALTACEAIWPGQQVHAVFDVELVALGMQAVAGAGQNTQVRTANAERQRDTLLAALKCLLEHEGTVSYTGIGEMPSEELEEARKQAQIAIREVESA
ncbi:hypothetical protein F2S72_08745 [Pseudomonas syringae pv. actinidiae]|nr:hypothetical protein [Pseudomonas syringae pv. actinidiae]